MNPGLGPIKTHTPEVPKGPFTGKVAVLAEVEIKGPILRQTYRDLVYENGLLVDVLGGGSVETKINIVSS